MGSLYLGLVHFPIKNKRGEKVVTSVTNLDIHDISRSCKTFGVSQYFLITPLEAQHDLLSRILGHWEEDKSGAYNPDRQDALELARGMNSFEDCVEAIKEKEGQAPKIIVTGANFEQYNLTCDELSKRISIDNDSVFLLFGTGWGLHASLVEQADDLLEPIFGHSKNGYNHLSVRSAVAIYLDRIMGK